MTGNAEDLTKISADGLYGGGTGASKRMHWKGVWSGLDAYAVNDVVITDKTYICTTASGPQAPPSYSPPDSPVVLGSQIIYNISAYVPVVSTMTVPDGTNLVVLFIENAISDPDRAPSLAGHAFTRQAFKLDTSDSSFTGVAVDVYTLVDPPVGDDQVLTIDQSAWLRQVYAVYCTGSVGVTDSVVGPHGLGDITLGPAGDGTGLLLGFASNEMISASTLTTGTIVVTASTQIVGRNSDDGTLVWSWGDARNSAAVSIQVVPYVPVPVVVGPSVVGAASVDLPWPASINLPSGSAAGDLAIILMYQDNWGAIPAGTVTNLGYGTLFYEEPNQGTGGHMAGARICGFSYSLTSADIALGHLLLPTLAYLGTTSGVTLTVFRGVFGPDVANIVRATGDNLVEATTTPAGPGFLLHYCGSEWTPPAATPGDFTDVAIGLGGRQFMSGVSTYVSGATGGYTWPGNSSQIEWAGGAGVIPILAGEIAPPPPPPPTVFPTGDFTWLPLTGVISDPTVWTPATVKNHEFLLDAPGGDFKTTCSVPVGTTLAVVFVGINGDQDIQSGDMHLSIGGHAMTRQPITRPPGSNNWMCHVYTLTNPPIGAGIAFSGSRAAANYPPFSIAVAVYCVGTYAGMTTGISVGSGHSPFTLLAPDGATSGALLIGMLAGDMGGASVLTGDFGNGSTIVWSGVDGAVLQSNVGELTWNWPINNYISYNQASLVVIDGTLSTEGPA